MYPPNRMYPVNPSSSMRPCQDWFAIALLIAAPLACVSPSRRSSDATATVLVYNIHAGKDAALVDNLERVASVIRSTGADIVLLQEVDRNTTRSGGVDQPAVLARLTGLHVEFGKSLDYQGGDYGIAILSRWPIRSRETVHLKVDPPQQRAGGSYEPRVALHVVVDAPVGPVSIVNTHLDASGDDRWRRQEVVTLIGVATGALVSGDVVLLGGDFNSTPESAVQDTVHHIGLTDAWNACGSGNGLTWPADSSVKRIDYLFTSDRARCTQASVPRTEASDHRPLLVKLRLRRSS